jgi:hypothetical protein
MKFILQIFNSFKEILFIPRNLVNINRQSNNIIGMEKKLEAINQKLNELDIQTILQKLDTLSQNQANAANIKTKAPINLELNELVSKIQVGFENHFLQLESLLLIYNSLPNLKFLPATRGWAGSPDFLAKIVELILKEKPLFVLEAGSGVSSVIIGLALKLNNYGESFSLEQDPKYLESTRKNIEINQLEDVSSLFSCPLVEYEIENETWKWYQTDKLNITDKIDLLIIDGPPRTIQNLARYPAIPLLYQLFSNKFTVMLDDAKRIDEAIIVEKWVEFLKMKGCEINVEHCLNFEKGMVILNVNKQIK